MQVSNRGGLSDCLSDCLYMSRF